MWIVDNANYLLIGWASKVKNDKGALFLFNQSIRKSFHKIKIGPPVSSARLLRFVTQSKNNLSGFHNLFQIFPQGF